MTAKELARNAEKGISTITQLSYGYRPRRRRHVKPTAPRDSPPVKHDHKLKALAIKKDQIHVVGSPSLSIEGTPVFMDVEGVPDRDFYYLIGLRYEAEGVPVEQSFWADGPESEREIWQQCLCALKRLATPQIVHYGAYESRFLKHMRERWDAPVEDAEFLDQLIEESVNLLGSIYGRIYFPAYSNGLKDIARWLGFEWTWPQASGRAAMLMRRCWELTSDEGLQRKLIAYNIEDCRATAVVANALARICGTGESGGETKLEAVNVSSLEVGFQRTFGKFPSALTEFETINAAAYWDYQRSKVYVRTNRATRRTIKRSVNPVKKVAVDKEVIVDDRPTHCSRCGASNMRVHERCSRIIFDLKFTRRGIKRWVVRYRYGTYWCSACRAKTKICRMHSKYGDNLRAYIIYLLIEMRPIAPKDSRTRRYRFQCVYSILLSCTT